MHDIEVLEVNSPQTLSRFLRLPWRIYSDDENWVPPLLSEQRDMFDPAKHPFHKHSKVQPFLCVTKDGEDVGRICAIHNRNHLSFHEDGRGFFGFLEAVRDEDVFRALFNSASEWLSERGCSRITGPTEFSTNEQCALFLDGEPGPPVLMMPYTPPYYNRLLERVGFTKAKDLYAYKVSSQDGIPERLQRVVDMLSERREASVRPVDMGNLDREVSLMFDIYNSAWEKNWGFVPMTREEFEYSAKDFAKIAEPELVLFLLVKGEPVGFSLALPDYNVAFRHMNGRLFPFGFLKFLWHKRHIERIRVLAMGMKKEYRGLGLDSIMYLETFRRGIGAGYTEAELSWVLEDNVEMKRAAEKIGGTLYRTYRIYEKSL